MKHKQTPQELISRARALLDGLERELRQTPRDGIYTAAERAVFTPAANDYAKALQAASYGLYNATRSNPCD